MANNKSGKEYLVEGALLMCINGSKKSILRIPEGHGYTSNGRKKANCRDCKACKNIPYFGECAKNTKTHTCAGFMKLADKWESLSPSVKKPEKVAGQPAISMDSVLICKRGGLIIPLTSGQGYEKRIDWAAFKRRFCKAMQWALGKNLLCHIFGNDPINLNTGNYIYEKEELVIPGITTLSFRLFYNSMEKGRGGCVGEGWHHNYSMHIREEENGKLLYICMDDGREIPYRRTVGDVYTPTFGDRGLLKREADGFRYCVGTGKEYTFDSKGLLCTQNDQNGNTDIFIHNRQGQLVKAVGANGGELSYTYNAEGNLIRIKDHTGRQVELWYKYGKLWKFINASGYAYFYDYNPNGKLESVVTPRGIRGVFNEYDAADRVIKQILADGSVTEFMYDDENRRTYVKEANGSMVIHESDERFRNVKTIYEDGEEHFEYNDSNRRTLYVDKNGNATRYRYDEKGNLIGMTDALGNVTEMSYNEMGRMTSLKKPGGGCILYSYDKEGRLVKKTDALGRSYETSYNEKGLPVCITQPDGSNIHMMHDDRGNVTGITDPYGAVTTYCYDALNRVTAVTDAEGNTVRYQYDEQNHLTEVINQEGNVRKHTYNESGSLIQIKDYDGEMISISYNKMGKADKITDKEGRETKKYYDLMGNIEKEVSPTGVVTIYQYDRNNRIAKIEVLGANQEEPVTTIEYAYDLAGNQIRAIIKNGNKTLKETSYEYDELNRMTAIIEPYGGKTLYTYDHRNGKIKSITDPLGNQKYFCYNNAGELTETTDIRGNNTHYEYNALGKVTLKTDGVGRSTRYYYQPGGRLMRCIYPDRSQMDYGYDTLGRVNKKIDEAGYSVFYEYDSMGRVLQIRSNEGQKKAYTYDALGNVVMITDAYGNTTQYAYTKNGKVKEVTDAYGNRTSYIYDKSDCLTQVCQNGKPGEAERITTYERNAFGQIECICDALGEAEYYQYDAFGRMVQKTDREGFETKYTYAADDKIESIRYGDDYRVEFEYTPLRQLALVKDWLGETKIERNLLGEPVQITNHDGKKICYEWGKMGERKGMTYSDGTVVRWNYDELLRPVKMTREAKGKAPTWINYLYDQKSRLINRTSSGGYSTNWKYNVSGQIEMLMHEDDSGVLDRCNFEYDLLGNKIAIIKERRGLPEETGNYNYNYDNLRRLIEVKKEGVPLRRYSYDSFGNRICMEDYERDVKSVYRYDELNRIVEEGRWKYEEADIIKKYTYDKRGNLIEEYENDRLLHGYTFGAINKMTYAWDENSEAEYFYNGLGQRIGRKSQKQREDYLLDLTKPYNNLLEIENDDKVEKFYWDYGVAITENEMGSIRYYLQDDLGSPLRVLYGNGKGDVYGYDEFGGDLYEYSKHDLSETKYTKQGKGQPFGYSGYRFDTISNTYFAQEREYKPNLGRFTAEDIIRGNGAVPKTLNRYVYCWGNPATLVDPDGKIPIAVVPALIVLPFILSGCGSKKEEETIRLDVEKQPVSQNTNVIPPANAVQEPKVPQEEPTKNLINSLDDYDITTRTEFVNYLAMSEDFRSEAYYATESEDNKTIGYGHLCDDEEKDAKYLQDGYVMTKEEAEQLFAQDMKEHIPEEFLNSLFSSGVSLYDYQIDVLVSLHYNGGKITPKDSKNFYNYLLSKEYTEEETLFHMMSYTIQEGEVLPGLVKRRIAEAMIFAGLGYPKISNGDFYGNAEYKKLLFDYANQFDIGEYNNRICKCLE